MRYVAIGLVLSLCAAAAVVALMDRFQGGPPPSAATVEDLSARLAALERQLAQPPRSERDPRTLAEIARMVEENQGLILDAERNTRRDLQGIYERLLARLDELGAQAKSGEPNTPEARAAVHARLKELGVSLKLDEGQIEVQGTFSETDRPLEFLLVAVGGRAYESLFLAEASPSALKIAVEELGFSECDPDPETFRWPKDAPGLTLYARWAGRELPCRVEDLIWNRETDQSMEHTRWMFTASRFFTDNRTWERHFAAELYKNLVALSLTYAGEAIIANPLEAAANENIFFPNRKLCPASGTPVTLILCKEPVEAWDKS
jgi:hypothetical protein